VVAAVDDDGKGPRTMAGGVQVSGSQMHSSRTQCKMHILSSSLYFINPVCILDWRGMNDATVSP
jgi:hypothetical protein